MLKPKRTRKAEIENRHFFTSGHSDNVKGNYVESWYDNQAGLYVLLDEDNVDKQTDDSCRTQN